MQYKIRPNIEDEKKIINSYLYEGNQTQVSNKYKITRRVLKEVLFKNNIPLRSQPESLQGKQLGKENPNWKGGCANEHIRKEFGAPFKKMLALWSALIRHTDDYKCRQCGKEGEDSHHIICIRKIYRKNLDRNLIWNMQNGILLCKSCHMKTHLNEEIFEETFQKLIKNRLNSVKPLQDVITNHVRQYRAKLEFQKTLEGVTTR